MARPTSFSDKIDPKVLEALATMRGSDDVGDWNGAGLSEDLIKVRPR